MTKICMRGIHKIVLVILLLVACSYIVFGYVILTALLDSFNSLTEKCVSYVLIIACFVVPGMLFLGYGVVQYNRKITVTAQYVTESFFGRTVRSFSINSITAYGCAVFGVRDSAFFFCTLPDEQIEAISAENKDLWKLWGSKRYALRDTVCGRWQMDVAVVFRKRKKYGDFFISFPGGTRQKLSSLEGLLKKAPLYVGPLCEKYDRK